MQAHKSPQSLNELTLGQSQTPADSPVIHLRVSKGLPGIGPKETYTDATQGEIGM